MILLLEPNEDLFFRTEYAEWVRLVCKISNVSGNISVKTKLIKNKQTVLYFMLDVLVAYGFYLYHYSFFVKMPSKY